LHVLLRDIDSKWANLALMKISAWHKSKGDSVALNRTKKTIDKVYISCVFSKNKGLALGMAKMFSCPVEIGGSGIDLTTQLPDEIEHQKPDYSLYGIRHSMGFTSRGCFRKCPWCVVPQKEGMIRNHAPLKEFYIQEWHKLLLLDNNFLAAPRSHENLKEINARKIKVCFTQGLDIRLIDNENARLLSKTHYTNSRFNKKRLYFAWDIPSYEDKILQGITTLKKHGIRPQNLFFYILTNYNTTPDEDKHRVETLIKHNIKPYIMIYNKPKAQKQLLQYQLYINGGYYTQHPTHKTHTPFNLTP